MARVGIDGKEKQAMAVSSCFPSSCALAHNTHTPNASVSSQLGRAESVEDQHHALGTHYLRKPREKRNKSKAECLQGQRDANEPALWEGLMPMPSFVMMAEVSGGTRNCDQRRRLHVLSRDKEEIERATIHWVGGREREVP